MSKQFLFIVFLSLFLFLCSHVFSQESDINNNLGEEQSAGSVFKTAAENNISSQAIYLINSIRFIVDGYSKPYALMYHGEFTEGEEITGLSNLNIYLSDKQQLLYNQRVLESVRIEHTIGAERPDGKYPVDLVIYVKDTWNIMVIPRPQYSDNTGFDLTLKARDYNFLGTMSPLRVDLGYQYDQDGNNYISTMIDSDIPFNLFGLNWDFNFDHYYNYHPDLEIQHFYRNDTGLSVELPFKRTIFNIGVTESFIVNQENPERYRKDRYKDGPKKGTEYGRFHEGLYMSTNPYMSWKIPTGLPYFHLGEINYTPTLSATFIHEFPQWPLPEFRKGPYLSFSHYFDFGRINWKGNFQSGFYARASNAFSYNFYKLREEEQPWSTNIILRGVGHKVINNFMGVSARLMYRHYFFDDYNDNAGDALRGVLDNSVKASNMISFNLDVPFRVLKFRPSEWSVNNKFLRIFDFDLHAIPIVDVALYNYNNSNDPDNQKVFGLSNLLLTAGFEVIIFPERWRSLFLRISYGRNLSVGDKENTSEIFIGTELHY